MPGITPESASFATSLARSMSPRVVAEHNSALSRLLVQHQRLRHAPLSELVEVFSETNRRHSRPV